MCKSILTACTVFVMFMINVNAQTDVKPPFVKPAPVIESVDVPFMGFTSKINPPATIAEIEAQLGMSIQAYIIYLQGLLANNPYNPKLPEQIAYYQGLLNGDKPSEPTTNQHENSKQ